MNHNATKPCKPADYTTVGSHSSDNMVAAAVSVITSDSVVSDVAIFFDGHQSEYTHCSLSTPRHKL